MNSVCPDSCGSTFSTPSRVVELVVLQGGPLSSGRGSFLLGREYSDNPQLGY